MSPSRRAWNPDDASSAAAPRNDPANAPAATEVRKSRRVEANINQLHEVSYGVKDPKWQRDPSLPIVTAASGRNPLLQIPVPDRPSETPRFLVHNSRHRGLNRE